MSFTDDDLKRLKDELTTGISIQSSLRSIKRMEKLQALLARLEAAEACIGKVGFNLKYTTELENWRRAAGKEKGE